MYVVRKGMVICMTKYRQEVLDRLDREYGNKVMCYLDHKNAEELLIATILSAQCTDARVNVVTETLFQKYTTVVSFANADPKELEKEIHSTGFYHNKTKNIIACCKALMDKHNGKVPSEMEALLEVPGVGRKPANVVRGNIFHEPSIVVDTHVKRISKKLGFTKEEDPVKIEFDLMKKLPRGYWIRYNTHIIKLGREICIARRPKCDNCCLNDICPSAGK